MPAFELRRLLLLHALSTHGTLAAAARALHLTGPAVSQQLAVLEREVGMALVEKDGRRLKLTEAGSVLVSHTDVLLGQLSAAEADLAALRGEVTGTVRLGAFSTVLRTVVPVAANALRSRHQGRLRLLLSELEPEESIAALRAGEVDLAVVHAYDTLPLELPAGFEQHELLLEPLHLAVPADDPVAVGTAPAEPVDLATLADRSWVSSRPGTHCYQASQRACGAAGFVPTGVAHCADFSTQLVLVASGTGVALVPRLATADAPTGVAFRPLATPVLRTVRALTRRGGDRHPAVRIVRDALVEAFRAQLSG